MSLRKSWMARVRVEINAALIYSSPKVKTNDGIINSPY